MAYTTTTTTAATAPASRVKESSQPSLETRIQVALEHARRLTAMYGTDNIEVAIAWETVDELQKVDCRRRTTKQTSLERFCDENPDAPECRIYED